MEGAQDMKGKKWQIVLSGAGGQGLILAGTILGEAAVLEDGLYAVQTQSYGVESRGGFSKAEVVISPEEIAYPKVIQPDIIVALTKDAYLRAVKQCHDTCEIIYDTSVVDPSENTLGTGFAFTDIAREMGSTAVVNMIALGVVVKMAGCVSPHSIESVLSKKYSRFPINIDAFKKGQDLLQ
jgi:2-oxoglutarate ferredoxin oxidoreductase subunit gamma